MELSGLLAGSEHEILRLRAQNDNEWGGAHLTHVPCDALLTMTREVGVARGRQLHVDAVLSALKTTQRHRPHWCVVIANAMCGPRWYAESVEAQPPTAGGRHPEHADHEADGRVGGYAQGRNHEQGEQIVPSEALRRR